MRKFTKKRSTEDINAEMLRLEMEIDDSDFKKGGDWITYRGVFYKKPVSIVVNVCNGWFFVYNMNGDILASHRSMELDNEEWYANLLNVIYEE